VTALEARNLGKAYSGGGEVAALAGVDLRIAPGEFVAICGPSGAGKSTLSNLLALLEAPSSGDCIVDGIGTATLTDAERTRLRSASFAFVFQAFHLIEARSAAENVEMGLVYRAVPRKARRQAAVDALDSVGLGGKEDRTVAKLSGGERQRVAIARAVVGLAPVIIADEPSGNLDTANSTVIMDLLSRLNGQGRTLIVVTHDEGVARLAGRRIQLVDGKVVEDSAHQAAHQPGEHRAPKGVTAAESADQVKGRPSRLRFVDLLSDAWLGVRHGGIRAVSLVAAVALACGLGVATIGLSQTARYQVSDVFDAAANRRVALAVPGFDSATPVGRRELAALTSAEAVERLAQLRGVESATLLVNHLEISLSARSSDEPVPVTLHGIRSSSPLEAVFDIDFANGQANSFGGDGVIVGQGLARSLAIGPLAASPSIWIGGRPVAVAGVLTDAGYRTELLNAVIMSEPEASALMPPSYAAVELAVLPGAARQVGGQAAVAWNQTSPRRIEVNVPPDPAAMRAPIEASVRSVLVTLTGVALLLAVMMLVNTTSSAVLQRTPEFGIRRALGARRLHLAGLVVAEAVITGALGGVAGTYLGVLGELAATAARHWTPVLDPLAVALGPPAGVVIGLLAGLLAIRPATRIDPASAVRQ
jgi:macrolide transport system ATP-binding/permease protein